MIFISDSRAFVHLTSLPPKIKLELLCYKILNLATCGEKSVNLKMATNGADQTADEKTICYSSDGWWGPQVRMNPKTGVEVVGLTEWPVGSYGQPSTQILEP